jgi:hypothetical protein
LSLVLQLTRKKESKKGSLVVVLGKKSSLQPIATWVERNSPFLPPFSLYLSIYPARQKSSGGSEKWAEV